MSRFLLSLTAGLAIALTPRAAVRAELYLFIAAVSEYEHGEEFRPLPEQLRTAREFRDVVVASMLDAETRSQRVILLENPTRQQILDQLTALRSRLTRYDHVVLLVSGHGIQNQTGEPTFCPRDAKESAPGTRLAHSELVQCLEVPQTQRLICSGVLLIMDCCRVKAVTGGIGNGPPPPGLKVDFGNLRFGTVVFCGCSEGAEVVMHKLSRRSHFMDALILGWKGAADLDGDQQVKLGEFLDFVKSDTAARLARDGEAPQVPEVVPYKSRLAADVFNKPFLRKRGANEVFFRVLPANWESFGSFKRTVFNGVTFAPAAFRPRLAIDDKDFMLAHFNGCTFRNCDITSSTDFRRAIFENCKFENCDFQKAQGISSARFIDCASNSTYWFGGKSPWAQ